MRRALGLMALGMMGALPAAAQELAVSLNGAPVPSGAYVANIFLNTCNGSLDAGGSAFLDLQWSVPANMSSEIFGDTRASCNIGDGGASTGGVETTITPTCAGSPNCGEAIGNVSIDLREVMSAAVAQLYPGVAFDGGAGGPCNPPEALTLYVCVVEAVEDGTLGFSQAAQAWFLTVNFNTNLPPPPSDLAGQAGDSDVSVNWTYASADLPADHFIVSYQPDPTPRIVPNANGLCPSDMQLDAGAAVDGWKTQSVPATQANTQVSGLTNGVCYDFVAQAILADGTAGAVSNEIVVAPSGPSGSGGCQTGGGATGAAAASAVILALLRARKRRA